jgi:hypothetical protein
MRIAHARDIARNWLKENSRKIEDYVGGYLSGSTAWGDPQAPFKKGSDIDLFIVVDREDTPTRPGKTLWKELILEINYVSLSSISDPKEILTDYHLAGAFICDGLLSDPNGKIQVIRNAVAQDFANPEHVRHRCCKAKERALDFLGEFRRSSALNDRVTNLFFGAGACAHMILVADKANPTIRRRYVEVQSVLKNHKRLDFHEQLLTSLGSVNWSRQTAEGHLTDIAVSFDLACSVLRSPYQFASDMTIAARPIAVEGSAEMIAAGFHREAAFWLIAVLARCRAAIALDGSTVQLAEVDARLYRLLRSLDIRDESEMAIRADLVELDVLNCLAVCEDMISGSS